MAEKDSTNIIYEILFILMIQKIKICYKFGIVSVIMYSPYLFFIYFSFLINIATF